VSPDEILNAALENAKKGGALDPEFDPNTDGDKKTKWSKAVVIIMCYSNKAVSKILQVSAENFGPAAVTVTSSM
jgi:hypothetical protein